MVAHGLPEGSLHIVQFGIACTHNALSSQLALA
jgi:hypothetical protein